MLPNLFRSLVCSCLVLCVVPVWADQRSDPREQALSDALDLWREGRFEQLYDSLSHRSGMTRERFEQTMRDAARRPACCFTKLRDFRLIEERKTTAKVFARVGMEGNYGSSDATQSREFTLDHEENSWKLRLSEIKALSGQARGKRN